MGEDSTGAFFLGAISGASQNVGVKYINFIRNNEKGQGDHAISSKIKTPHFFKNKEIEMDAIKQAICSVM